MRKLLPLLLCVAVAGCGGDDDDGGGAAKTSEEKQPAAGSGGTAAEGASVAMKNIEFKPKAVTVKKGGMVKWTNDDSVGHDVTGSDFKSGSAGGISGGETFEHRFAKAGRFDYRCNVHLGMEGTVIVK